MIIFDGIDLQSVADVKVEDIHINPIEYSVTSRPRAISAGSYFVRNRSASRNVSITFALLSDNRYNRQASLLAISQWAKTDKEYKLELPGYPDMYLMCVCTSKPEPSMRQWWESKLRIVFTCVSDPCWNSVGEHQVECGEEFQILGDAVPHMRIVRTLSSPASNQSYTMNGNTMTFSSIPAGELVIDLDNQTAEVDGVSIMQNYNVNSSFLVPQRGFQTCTGAGTVVYKERWQ